MQAKNIEKRYTYADYATWDGEQRWELIDGVAYSLASPSRLHQEISMNLAWLICNYLRGKSCKIYAAPFDVRLSADKEDDTVVQPDLSIICDTGKLTDKGCDGAPDMVMEILSPSSEALDLGPKLIKYMKAGVWEYWAIDPKGRKLYVYQNKDGPPAPLMYNDKAKVRISVLDDCVIDLAEVFPPEEGKVEKDP